MRIAVLTLTRDRLDYTRHCFATLRENAGCEFDWYVLDQGSKDGTWKWLLEPENEDLSLCGLDENIGVCRALNLLLDHEVDAGEYDVVVRFDNDCEVLQRDTLKIVCDLALRHNAILAPRVQGLRNPPRRINQLRFDRPDDWPYIIDETEILGGIFMAIPAKLFTEGGFRYDERFPPWSGDEAICAWHRSRGGRCGYVQVFAVNHYLTTDGQHEDKPEYFARSRSEGKPD